MVLIWMQCEKFCMQHFIQNWKRNNSLSGIKIYVSAKKADLWQDHPISFSNGEAGYAPDEKENISTHLQERQGRGPRKLQATQPNSWIQKDCAANPPESHSQTHNGKLTGNSHTGSPTVALCLTNMTDFYREMIGCVARGEQEIFFTFMK